MVLMERALILRESCERHADLPRVPRQAAILRDLCSKTTPLIEPGDIFAGRIPQVVPDAEGEALIAQRPELFLEPGVPGCLDSLSIYAPDWEWLLEEGLGGVAGHARRRLDEAEDEARREFLTAAIEALESMSLLVTRYAEKAERQEIPDVAERCRRVAWEPPRTLLDALQLLQLVHMVLSCLVGGRDVTPARVDQYLLHFYEQDLAEGRLTRDEAVVALAHFLLRLSQAAGNAGDFDDNERRTPCMYSHLYVTVGGCDAHDEPADNDLSLAILDAVDLLEYKEPTVLVRYRDDVRPELKRRVAELVAGRRPVTVYNDGVVIEALMAQGVSQEDARTYAHSACHNALLPGLDAGSGPNFHNLPALLLRAMEQADDVEDLETFHGRLVDVIREHLAGARAAAEQLWENRFGPECPLLQSCLMPASIDGGRPCWRAAKYSHYNHYLLGLGTTVDSLLAIRELCCGPEAALTLASLRKALAEDWSGHEALRKRIRNTLPRHGQDADAAREVTARLGATWVEEVERASTGLERLEMWPAFYSHIVHVHRGAETPATPDGRKAGEPLSEALGPSAGTPDTSPTSVLRAMAELPFDHTPSGAAALTLSPRALSANELIALLETYFRLGGLHLHITYVDPETLAAAVADPESHADLMVRVAGYSAYFTRLSPNVQQDVLNRYLA